MKKTLRHIYNLVPLKKFLFMFVRLFNPPESVFKHLYFIGIFRVKFDGKKFLIKHYGYEIENDVFWKGIPEGWERVSMKLWIELCRESNVIMDIGANTGIYSLVAKAVNPQASVYAVEPVKRIYEKLIFNCRLNNFDIRCLEYGISNYDGVATIFDTPSEHTYSVTLNRNTLSKGAAVIKTSVKTKKISTFIRENNLSEINLMKIDVETHEPEVLEGMEDFLKEFKPTIFVEVLNDEIGKRVELFFQGLGYLYFSIDETQAPERVSHIIARKYYNYLICSEKVARELKLI